MQDDNAKKEYEAKAADLKSQLKHWEADVAKRNGGKKPSRDDIKQNPEIQAKYKKYQQIRDMLDGKPVREKKRKPEAAPPPPPDQTPTKRPRPQATPTATRRSHVDDFETPEIRRLFSPAMPTSIGPTPQRDGRVLGLFDLLDETDENHDTPSKDRQGGGGAPGGAGAGSLSLQATTPSKRKRGDAEPPAAGADSTPVATGRRAMFMTPLKNRDGNAQGGGGPQTPSSVTKLLFSTPSFLRRAPLPAVAEQRGDGDPPYASPRRPRLPRKPLARGLSSVVAGLRKMEEEHLDDDMEALREMEAAEGGDGGRRPAGPVKKAAHQPKESKPPREEVEEEEEAEAAAMEEDVLAPDSQAGGRLLGGFDDENALDSEPEAQLDRHGQPLKVYKKKGQKRTTRRVNMRPTRAKRPAAAPGEVVEEEDDNDEDVVAETQRAAAAAGASSGSDYDSAGSDDDEGDKRPNKKTKKKASGGDEDAAVEDKKAGAVKKAAKKVNELAHANFKRLKLKNHGAKGGPGFGSRFRRRR